jgi:arylsulfatase A-like enzyme
LGFSRGRLGPNSANERSRDATVRVPLLVRLPHHEGVGRVVETPVSLLDLVPTILDVSDLSPTIDAGGVSLLPLIRGDGDRGHPLVFTQAGYKGGRVHAVRNQVHKLIYVPRTKQRETMQGTPFELYDVRGDPRERENLADVEAKTVRELSRVLFEWLARLQTHEGHDEKTPELDPQTREAMRALGYLRE